MTEPRTQPLIAQSSPTAEIAPFFPGVVSGFELLLSVLVLAGAPWTLLVPLPLVDPPDCELALEPGLELALPLELPVPTEPSGDLQCPFWHVVPGLVTHTPGLWQFSFGPQQVDPRKK
jgi:hypothetical protein